MEEAHLNQRPSLVTSKTESHASNPTPLHPCVPTVTNGRLQPVVQWLSTDLLAPSCSQYSSRCSDDSHVTAHPHFGGTRRRQPVVQCLGSDYQRASTLTKTSIPPHDSSTPELSPARQNHSQRFNNSQPIHSHSSKGVATHSLCRLSRLIWTPHATTFITVFSHSSGTSSTTAQYRRPSVFVYRR